MNPSGKGEQLDCPRAGVLLEKASLSGQGNFYCVTLSVGRGAFQDGDTIRRLAWHPSLVAPRQFEGIGVYKYFQGYFSLQALKGFFFFFFLMLLTQVKIRANRPCNRPDQSHDQMANWCKHQDALPLKDSYSLFNCIKLGNSLYYLFSFPPFLYWT